MIKFKRWKILFLLIFIMGSWLVACGPSLTTLTLNNLVFYFTWSFSHLLPSFCSCSSFELWHYGNHKHSEKRCKHTQSLALSCPHSSNDAPDRLAAEPQSVKWQTAAAAVAANCVTIRGGYFSFPPPAERRFQGISWPSGIIIMQKLFVPLLFWLSVLSLNHLREVVVVIYRGASFCWL